MSGLRGRFCAHGIAGEDYCQDCHATQIENCDHEWFLTGLTTYEGQISECDKCGVTSP